MAKRYEQIDKADESPEKLEIVPYEQQLLRDTYSAGWRPAVLSCAASSSIVFLINFVVLLVTVKKYGVDDNGRQTIYNGNCNMVRRLNVVIHLFINGFSTVLLGSSNYCMQCLSAPSRNDIDAAHEGKTWPRWLDIGVPSGRNLWRIERKRAIIWILLGLSSFPLHLFFNSTVFTSVASYSYPIVVADDKFSTDPISLADIGRIIPPGTQAGFNQVPQDKYSEAATVGSSAARLSRKAMTGSLERLDVDSCLSEYGQNFVTSRGGLVLVLDSPPAPTSPANATIFDMVPSWSLLSADWCEWDQYSWVCQQDGNSACFPSPQCCHGCRCGEVCEARLPAIRANSSGWRPFNQDYPVKYCLSERLPEQCKLQASFHIALIVVILNLIKAALMFATFFGIRELPLLTVGDAIASFLLRRDPTTRYRGLISSSDVRYGAASDRGARPYSARCRRWFSAASGGRWALTLSLFVSYIVLQLLYVQQANHYDRLGAALMACIYLLSLGIRSIRGVGGLADLPSLWSLGIGTINAITIIDWAIPSTGAIGLISNVLVANLSQVVLSVIYFMYNGLFTSMFLASEWDSFSQMRRGLRVSWPAKGAQRSSYFLQLPYRVAFPLMAVSGVLHWLVSQSGFLIDIESYEWDDTNGEYTQALRGNNGVQVAHLVTCGFSPIAILLVIFVLTAMIIAVAATGCRRFKSGMPVASSCSIAISAACHPSEVDDGELDCSNLQWGVTGKSVDGIGHCSFSSREVYAPKDGVRYG